MADDEIERLLREVAATNGPGASAAEASGTAPSRQAAAPVVRNGGSTGGRLAFAGVAAGSMGVAGWAVGLLLPFVGAGSAGIGAALGAFVTAIVAGPPRWFSS